MSQNDDSDEIAGFVNDYLPSNLRDWDDWHRIALRKGNSQIFLHLGTWILLRFRQLAKIPVEVDVDGVLIPDHPANYEIDRESEFHEALGMTHLYSALAHIDTHPEYLAHIFHEIGKASSEERLGSSHPGFRPLPELPTPVKRYVAVNTYCTTNTTHSMILNRESSFLERWNFEMTSSNDYVDDDGGVSGALNEMIICGASESAPVDRHDAQKRKRTMSNTSSPPKVPLMVVDHCC